jgi:hypothetical protein
MDGKKSWPSDATLKKIIEIQVFLGQKKFTIRELEFIRCCPSLKKKMP